MGSFGFRVLSLGGQMIIYRVVEKDVVGLYRAMVLIHLMALALLPFGLDSLLVREKSRRARYVAACSQALALIGGGLALGTLVLALVPHVGASSFLGGWLTVGDDWPALLLMPLIFAVQAVKLSIRGSLAARLDFKKISIGEFGNGLITCIGGGIAALALAKAWPLMAMYLAGEVFECWWLFRREPFRPASILRPSRFSILKRLVRRHLGYCTFNTADLTLNNVASLLPGVLFVAWISKGATADYSVALQLLVLPVMLLSGALWRVTFPTISGVPDPELHRRCLAIIAGAAAFIAPAVLWFAFFAPSNVYLLAGGAFVETATPIVRWMAIYMVLVAVYTPISSLDMVRDRSEVGLLWNIVYTGGRVAIIWWLAPDGLLAVVAGIGIFSMAMWVANAAILGWLLGAGWGRYLAATLRLVPALGVYAGGLWLCIAATQGHLLWGPLLSVLPAIVYTVLLWRFHPEQFRLLMRLAGRR